MDQTFRIRSKELLLSSDIARTLQTQYNLEIQVEDIDLRDKLRRRNIQIKDLKRDLHNSRINTDLEKNKIDYLMKFADSEAVKFIKNR